MNEGEHYFLWLSDIHLDPHYGTPRAFHAQCRSARAPRLGARGCDAPRTLLRAALDHAVNVASARSPSRPAFVVVSGDSVRHGIQSLFSAAPAAEAERATARADAADAASRARAMDATGDALREAVAMVAAAFPGVEIIVSLGNNDVFPDYYLQLPEDAPPGGPALTSASAGMVGILFKALNGGASSAALSESANSSGALAVSEEPTAGPPATSLLTTADEGTFLRGGYYSRDLHNGTLTVLSLNTVLYSGNFQPAPQNAEDPGGQFSWMREVLASCHVNGGQAVILGHIPPAVGSYRHTQLWKDGYIQTYYNIVKEFDHVIAAQLFGHLHSDEFRVGLAEDRNRTTKLLTIPSMNTPLLLGPSVTPLHGNDPSFRLVAYGRRGTPDGAFRILDYESHRCSLGTDRRWSKLYTFSEAYDAAGTLKDGGLNSGTFRAVVQSMEDRWGRESPVLSSYRSLLLSGADGTGDDGIGANVECNSTCRDKFMCTFQAATRTGYESCLHERQHAWTRQGRNLLGLVGAVLCATVLTTFAIVRWRKASVRKRYDSTLSVLEI